MKLIKDNFTEEEQNKIIADFVEFVRYENPFDTADYKTLIKQTLDASDFPKGIILMDKEAIQNCLANALIKKGVNPYKEEVVADSYKTKRAKQKLVRLERELNEQHSKIKAHWQQTNGQPMNDKRGGQRFFNRAEELESKAISLYKEYEKQAERVAELVERDELAAKGYDTRTGGLFMTVENIPRIEEEIAKSERGESMFTRATIRRYKKKLVELKQQAKQVESMPDGAKKLVEAGKLNQWKKHPTIYFIKGLRKVALELKGGSFKVSSRYAPKDDDERQVVSDLLKEVNNGVIGS